MTNNITTNFTATEKKNGNKQDAGDTKKNIREWKKN